MKEQPIIEIKNISKKYKITHERGGYIALRDVVMNIVKQPFSYLKTKAKSVAGLEKKEDFWALKDVNFTVNKGEVIGIIGRNGAGKSTLLKILSQITPPTEGEIIMRGSVGSLLEVGTGFHPELTGRENIFLNGAILGMGRREIAKKFDQIVEFADIGKFLDTPVKYYSSGMYVRLAFSVAAHMEPDILLVDEVLAVGDAEFQKKCLGKMGDITKREGRTILFVSHNMGAIEKLCPRSILIGSGQIRFFGETREVIRFYTNDVLDIAKSVNVATKRRHGVSLNATFKGISFSDTSGNKIEHIQNGSTLIINLAYKSKNYQPLENVRIAIAFKNLNGQEIFVCSTEVSHLGTINLPAEGMVGCKIEDFPLSRGSYLITVALYVDKQLEDFIEDAAKIEVENSDFFGTGVMFPTTWEGKQVLVRHSWII